jgi:hypothetical protein
VFLKAAEQHAEEVFNFSSRDRRLSFTTNRCRAAYRATTTKRKAPPETQAGLQTGAGGTLRRRGRHQPYSYNTAADFFIPEKVLIRSKRYSATEAPLLY